MFIAIGILFLKRIQCTWQAKLGYFAFGAIVTYIINTFRAIGIFLFGLNGGDPNLFHQSYGPLLPITWIVLFPLVILGTQVYGIALKKKDQNRFDKPQTGN